MDPPIGDIVVDHAPVTYRIVEEGTKRRKISLVDRIFLQYSFQTIICHLLAMHCETKGESMQRICHSKKWYLSSWKVCPQPSDRSWRFHRSDRGGGGETKGIGRKVQVCLGHCCRGLYAVSLSLKTVFLKQPDSHPIIWCLRLTVSGLYQVNPSFVLYKRYLCMTSKTASLSLNISLEQPTDYAKSYGLKIQKTFSLSWRNSVY